jgi:hypothetical protein
MTRFCRSCAAEVEDRGGFCALGHRLKLNPLDSLRAEIDEVFDAALLEIAGAGPTPSTPPAASTQESSASEALASVSPASADDIPSGEVLTERARGVWAALEESVDVDGDPIEAFAPAPRMDWGPTRPALRGRLSPRRPSNAAI